MQVALFVVAMFAQLAVPHDPWPLQVAQADAAALEQSGSTAPQPQLQPSPPWYEARLHAQSWGTLVCWQVPVPLWPWPRPPFTQALAQASVQVQSAAVEVRQGALVIVPEPA